MFVFETDTLWKPPAAESPWPPHTTPIIPIVRKEKHRGRHKVFRNRHERLAHWGVTRLSNGMRWFSGVRAVHLQNGGPQAADCVRIGRGEKTFCARDSIGIPSRRAFAEGKKTVIRSTTASSIIGPSGLPDDCPAVFRMVA